jgi:hypothetical protein
MERADKTVTSTELSASHGSTHTRVTEGGSSGYNMFTACMKTLTNCGGLTKSSFRIYSYVLADFAVRTLAGFEEQLVVNWVSKVAS